MEQTRILSSHNFHLANTINLSSLDESWEEQAFAEDAAGALGWPPRSYSCSFCGREFRSAQALGGHMNVHRREKARSKQDPSDPNEIPNDNKQILQYPTRNRFTSMAFYYPSQVCNMVYNPNPIADFSDTLFSTSSSSRVSTPSTKGVFSEKILFSPSIADEKERDEKSPTSWSQFKRGISTDGIHDDEHNQRVLDKEEKSGRRTVDSDGNDSESYIKADLSVSLNLVICHSNLEVSDIMEEVASCKRRRADNAPSTPIFQDKLHVQSEIIGLASPTIDDLDLELRLGGRPRMN